MKLSRANALALLRVYNPRQDSHYDWHNVWGPAKLVEADVIQTQEIPLAENQRRVFRKWELSIPEFEVPGRRSALVVSVWAQDPGEEHPHLVTAIVRP